MTLVPFENFNITSAYGCYKYDTANDRESSKSSDYYDATLKFGCQGSWQADIEDFVYKTYDAATDSDVYLIKNGYVEK